MSSVSERELPMLAGIGAFVTWCEELLAILSGPILTAGLAIALIDLLSDGALLASLPVLLWVWAASQAIGLDAQFIGSAAKLARAIRRRHVGAIIGYIILCAALGYVGFLASNVFATQEANGITTTEALARLGMNSTSWIFQRSLLAVVLVFLSGFMRYVAPAVNVALSAEEEKARLEADLMLEPLRQQKRALQLRGARGAIDALRGKEPPVEPTPVPATAQPPQPPKKPAVTHDQSRPPTGPGSPVTAHPSQEPPAQAATAFAAVIDETEQQDEERESSRVLHIGRSRSAKRANARIKREAVNARRDLIRDASYAVFDEAVAAGEDPLMLPMRELVRRVNEPGRLETGVKTSEKTVKRHLASWQRDHARSQQQQAVR